MDNLSTDDDDLEFIEGSPRVGAIDIEHELEDFRRHWYAEIRGDKTTPAGDDVDNDTAGDVLPEEPSVEDQARYLFLQGVAAERTGRLYDAIQYYRRAVQLVPDIEFRIEELRPQRRERVREESESSACMSDISEHDDFTADLTANVQKLKCGDNDWRFCKPLYEQRSTHISVLPVEVIVFIFKWVVSSDLDVHSLEQLSMVCRGFYLCARDEELWRLVCHRIWGVNCTNVASYGSFRNMYIEKPHLRYNGCYISKSSYYRDGEKGLDNYYRPFHLVEYYRYARFFPEGKCILLTTPDDPFTALPKLRTRRCAVQGMLTGYYKMLSTDRVTAVLKRSQVVDYQQSMYRYRRQKNNTNNNDTEQTFHVEFTVKNIGNKPHWQLVWSHYEVHTVYRQTREETVTAFDLNAKSYPALMFSRVRSFTAVSDSPLM